MASFEDSQTTNSSRKRMRTTKEETGNSLLLPQPEHSIDSLPSSPMAPHTPNTTTTTLPIDSIMLQNQERIGVGSCVEFSGTEFSLLLIVCSLSFQLERGIWEVKGAQLLPTLTPRIQRLDPTPVNITISPFVKTRFFVPLLKSVLSDRTFWPEFVVFVELDLPKGGPSLVNYCLQMFGEVETPYQSLQCEPLQLLHQFSTMLYGELRKFLQTKSPVGEKKILTWQPISCHPVLYNFFSVSYDPGKKVTINLTGNFHPMNTLLGNDYSYDEMKNEEGHIKRTVSQQGWGFHSNEAGNHYITHLSLKFTPKDELQCWSHQLLQNKISRLFLTK